MRQLSFSTVTFFGSFISCPFNSLFATAVSGQMILGQFSISHPSDSFIRWTVFLAEADGEKSVTKYTQSHSSETHDERVTFAMQMRGPENEMTQFHTPAMI